jgi:hypothetical protein
VQYADGFPVNLLRTDAQKPFVLRTPDRPGILQECGNVCTGYRSKIANYAMGFRIESASAKYRISVGGPWLIEEVAQHGYVYCPFDPPKTARYRGCAVASTDKTFFVWTQDPNAPARNIVIERVAETEGCP